MPSQLICLQDHNSMDSAVGYSNTRHSKLNECLPTTAGKELVLMTFPTLEESTQLETECMECDGSSSRHECHRFPLLLLKVDPFLKHKHFSDCCKPWVEFQSTEMVVFACFTNLHHSKWTQYQTVFHCNRSVTYFAGPYSPTRTAKFSSPLDPAYAAPSSWGLLLLIHAHWSLPSLHSYYTSLSHHFFLCAIHCFSSYILKSLGHGIGFSCFCILIPYLAGIVLSTQSS